MSTNRNAWFAIVFIAALCAGVSLSTGVGSAQTGSSAPTPAKETAKTMTGAYEFSNATRDRRCTVDLSSKRAGAAGLRLKFSEGCTTVFPFVKDIVGWTIVETGSLQLLDKGGELVLELTEVENGVFEAMRPGDDVLFLQSVAAVEPPPPTPDEMAGEWDVVRRGRTICTLALANEPAPGGGYALALKPQCAAMITRFAPSSWFMDDRELLLRGGAGESWRFAQDDDKVWQRIPATRNPLSLVKK